MKRRPRGPSLGRPDLGQRTQITGPGLGRRERAAENAAAGSRGHAGGFFERVYAIVRRIPRGRVATYGQVAALLGHPRAARTVGWALRALPEESDVPWHRVINGSGRVTTGGRDQAASLQAQRLRRESVAVVAEGRIPLERFRWRPADSRRRPVAPKPRGAEPRPGSTESRRARR